MSVRKTTQYRGDVVMLLLNKIIKNKKLNYQQKKMLVMHMGLKPCARPPKKPMVLLYMVYEVVANGFNTICKAS